MLFNLEQLLATFSLNGQTVNILDFVGYRVSAPTTQFCCFRMKEATDNMQMNKRGGCIAIKLCLQKQVEVGFDPRVIVCRSLIKKIPVLTLDLPQPNGYVNLYQQ